MLFVEPKAWPNEGHIEPMQGAGEEGRGLDGLLQQLSYFIFIFTLLIVGV
jgi:hypothetical protein